MKHKKRKIGAEPHREGSTKRSCITVRIKGSQPLAEPKASAEEARRGPSEQDAAEIRRSRGTEKSSSPAAIAALAKVPMLERAPEDRISNFGDSWKSLDSNHERKLAKRSGVNLKQ